MVTQAELLLKRINPARFGWVLVLAMLGGIFLGTNFILPELFSAGREMYILQPMLWLTLAATCYLLWYLEERKVTLPLDRGLIATAVLIGMFQVAVLVIAGLFAGFGNSPYARQLDRTILNVWYFLTRLIGLEMCRFYLVTSLGRKRAGLGFGLTWLIMTFAMLPVGAYRQLEEAGQIYRFSGRLLLPGASENLLATYLAASGGPLASLAYYLPLGLFEWLSPILPDLSWIMIAFLGTLIPIINLFVVHEYLGWRSGAREKETLGKPSLHWSWMLVAVLAVGLAWFNSGMFGVRPSLISGPSMSPALLPGDIVVSKTVPPEEIQVGDIVRFRLENVYVVHRVVSISNEGNQVVIITQGDANNTPDTPLEPGQLEGKVVLIIPKLGWLSIYVRQLVAGG